MQSWQIKLLILCVAVCTLAGCGTGSKNTDFIDPPTTDVVLLAGNVEPGDRIALPANSGLGMVSAVADRIYTAASGRPCRRLRTVEGALIQRVACQRDDGVWILARDLRPNSSNGPANPNTGVVSSTDEQNQTLVPSSGSLMLLNQESTLPANTVLQSSDDAVFTGSTEVPMPNRLESVAFAEHELQAAPVPLDNDHAEPVLQAATEILESNQEAYALPAAVESLEVHSVEPALQAANESLTSNTTDTDLLANAERLIISREAYSAQVGAVPLAERGSEQSPQFSGAPVVYGATEPDIETVKRTVKANETLWSFAKRTTGNALNWERIAQINGITNAKALTSGTQLSIPAELVGEGD